MNEECKKSLGIATPCEKGEFMTTFSTIIYPDSCVVFPCFVMYNAHMSNASVAEV